MQLDATFELIDGYGLTVDFSPGWQGMLHQAIMTNPIPDAPHIVNSMLLTEAKLGVEDDMTDERTASFLDEARSPRDYGYVT